MKNDFFITIGLEIHAELKTKTKMFCACKNDPDETKPNVNVCPICMAHPGTLPVANKKAIESVVRVGLAIDGTIADFTEFDRKSYFYPDIPKGYQISQYKFPIVSGGRLADFDVTRVHLEEDTANSKHDRGDYSLIDYNRAGVPLMELVTEPHTFETAESASKAAGKFARELQLLLRYLDVSEANMEKGEMRVEANISISTTKEVYGTKVEVKNLNSFKSAERAIVFEVERMKKLYEAGKQNDIVQETRGWDETKQVTFSQRSKEDAQDYRYFPDPDLPKMKLHEVFDLETIKNDLPELPEAKRKRYQDDYVLKDEDIEMYVVDQAFGKWFADVATNLGNDKDKVKLASNYATSDLTSHLKKNTEAKLPTATYFSELIDLVHSNKITSRAAKDILAELVISNSSPLEVAEAKGLLQVHNEEALKVVVQKVIDENLKVIESYKAGKENALMSLVGAVMKETKGSANPEVVLKLLKEILA